MNSKRPATRVGRHFFKSKIQIKMEKYIIKYQERTSNYTAEVYAESEDEAIREVEKKMTRARSCFRITEVIPQGVVSGFEVRLVGSKIVYI